MKSVVKPGMTVVDVGANIGYYSIYFSRLVGKNGRVHAFEPDELNYNYLKKNTEKYKNIVINNAAVGERNGETLLYQSDLLNVDHQTYDSGEGRKTKKIRCVALDEYFKSGETVGVVKIDIQGYDYFAVKGMRRVLDRSRDIVLLGEFWPYGLKKSGIDAIAYIKLIEDIGFDIKFETGICEDYISKKEDDKFFYTGFIANKQAA